MRGSQVELAQLIEYAERRGIRVEWHDIGTANADYHHASRTIRLHPRRNVTVQRCALAHELGHAWHGHEPGGHYEAQERAADEYAAGLLISAHEYRLAERLVGHYPGQIAQELGVTSRIVEAWCRMQARRGVVA